MTAANEAPELLLQHHLRKLRLPSVLRAYEKLARQCAAEHADHVRYLARLIELALIDREARMVERRIKAARFPFHGIEAPMYCQVLFEAPGDLFL